MLDRREERLRHRRLHRCESGQTKVEEDHVRSVRHLAFVDLVPTVGEVLDLVTNDGKAVRSQVSSEETDGQVHCRNVKRRYSSCQNGELFRTIEVLRQRDLRRTLAVCDDRSHQRLHLLRRCRCGWDVRVDEPLRDVGRVVACRVGDELLLSLWVVDDLVEEVLRERTSQRRAVSRGAIRKTRRGGRTSSLHPPKTTHSTPIVLRSSANCLLCWYSVISLTIFSSCTPLNVANWPRVSTTSIILAVGTFSVSRSWVRMSGEDGSRERAWQKASNWGLRKEGTARLQRTELDWSQIVLKGAGSGARRALRRARREDCGQRPTLKNRRRSKKRSNLTSSASSD